MNGRPGQTCFTRRYLLALSFALLLLPVRFSFGSAADTLFQDGLEAYRDGDYAKAAQAFKQGAAQAPASGTLLNLGLAEWRRDQPGAAVLSWERVLWLEPWNKAARENLRFARHNRQLESPDLAWYEVISTWLPVNSWVWITGTSLWLAVAMTMLPGIMRRPKAAWHQAVAAFGLMVFLLGLPALAGVHTRSRLGFVLEKETPLRLTPTQQAQAVTRLAAGEPARFVRTRGKFVLVKTNRTVGWIEREQLGLISGILGK